MIDHPGRIKRLLGSAWQASGIRLVLLSATIICAAGWYLELRPVAVVWGTVGEIVGGFAAFLGLIFVALEIQASIDQREAEAERRIQGELERRESMARAVGIQGTPRQVFEGGGAWGMQYTVFNGGDYPIDRVMVVVRDPGGEVGEPADLVSTAGAEVLGTLLPKQEQRGVLTLEFSRDPEFPELMFLAGVLFTDTWGQHWYRSAGQLERREFGAALC